MHTQTLHLDPAILGDRLNAASTVTPTLISDVVAAACRRLPSFGAGEKAARITDLIQLRAWTDAALALIELELPFWKVRRIAYDEGEWYCALSRERELPDWLDRSIEARHSDLPLAILGAFVEAERVMTPASRTSVPSVARDASPLYEPVCCDNFS